MALATGPGASAQTTQPLTQAEVLYNISKGTDTEKIEAIGNIDLLGDPEYAARLLAAAATDDRSIPVRTAALQQLSRFAKYGDAERAALTAAVDSAPEVRGAAIGTLGFIKTDEARGAISSALMDKDESVRLQALRATGRQKDPAAIEKLLFAMHGANFETRRECARALAQIGDPKTTGNFAELARDESPAIGAIAMHALGAIGTEQAQAILRRIIGTETVNFTVRAAAASALGAVNNDDNIDFLIETARSGEPEIAAGAVRGLGKCGKKVLDPLSDILKNGQTAALRRLAGQMLAGMKDPESVPEFARLARDTAAGQELRLDSLDWLYAADTPAALAVLKELSQDKTPAVSAKARELLAKKQEKL